MSRANSFPTPLCIVGIWRDSISCTMVALLGVPRVNYPGRMATFVFNTFLGIQPSWNCDPIESYWRSLICLDFLGGYTTDIYWYPNSSTTSQMLELQCKLDGGLISWSSSLLPACHRSFPCSIATTSVMTNHLQLAKLALQRPRTHKGQKHSP